MLETTCDRFRIIRILDEFSVVIDGGYESKIKEGDLFQIYVPGETIRDFENPDKEIGTIDTVKATIVATQVSPEVTICKNAKTGPIGLDNGDLQKMLSFIKPIHRPLHIDPSQVEPIALSKEPIKLGDKVRKLPK